MVRGSPDEPSDTDEEESGEAVLGQAGNTDDVIFYKFTSTSTI